MKKILIIIPFAFVMALAKAQTLSATVVSSAAGESISESGALEWTLGEIMVETFEHTQGYLTQGFHQPATITITGLNEAPIDEFSVYPNPTRGILYLKTENHCDCKVKIFDSQGRQLLESIETLTNEHHAELDLENFNAAVYVLQVFNMRTGSYSIYKVQKH
jgi:hypothetical protein